MSASELVVALGYQDFAGVPFMAKGTVSGGKLLIRLGSIARRAIPQQPHPILGRD